MPITTTALASRTKSLKRESFKIQILWHVVLEDGTTGHALQEMVYDKRDCVYEDVMAEESVALPLKQEMGYTGEEIDFEEDHLGTYDEDNKMETCWVFKNAPAEKTGDQKLFKIERNMFLIFQEEAE